MQNDREEVADMLEGIALRVDAVLITEEMCRLPAEIAHVGARLALADEALLRAEAAVEHAEARVYLMLRAEGVGKEKATEAMLKAQVTISDEVMEAQARMIDARALRDRMRALNSAVMAKQYMVSGVAANTRAEMGSIDRQSMSGPRRQQANGGANAQGNPHARPAQSAEPVDADEF